MSIDYILGGAKITSDVLKELIRIQNEVNKIKIKALDDLQPGKGESLLTKLSQPTNTPTPSPIQDNFVDDGIEFLKQVSRQYRHSSNPITEWRSWKAFDVMVKSERLKKIIQ